jgi:hypothetical protein
VKGRWPLIVSIGAFVVIAIAWIVTDRRAPRHAFDAYSTANTSGEGTSLAFAYLRKQGRRAGILTKPIATSALERNAVVFRITAEPVHAFDAAQLEHDGKTKPQRELIDDDEQAFVRGGGRLVIAAAENWLGVTKTATAAKRVFPLWPGVDSVELPQGRGFGDVPPQLHALFTAGGRIVIGRQRLGAGEVIVVAAPEIFQNEHLGGGKRLAVVAALAGTARPVYFDEVPHGLAAHDGAINMLEEWGFGPFLLLLLALVALLLWRHGTRIGPPQDDYRDTRSDAVDLVRSLAALYQRGTTKTKALELYHDALVRTVAAHSGLRGEALHKRVSTLTGPVDVDADFRTRLEIINDAFRKLGTGGKHANHR